MARHRRNEKHTAIHRIPPGHVEMNEIAEGARDDRFDSDQMIAPVFAGDRFDAPIGFDNHPLKAAFGHFAPSGHPAQSRVWCHAENGIGC